jgi:hypothetical protein
MPDPNEPAQRPQRHVRVISMVVAAIVGIVGVPLLLMYARAAQEQRQASAEVRQAMVEAGIPADRRAWVETLPVVPPEENLAMPFTPSRRCERR